MTSKNSTKRDRKRSGGAVAEFHRLAGRPAKEGKRTPSGQLSRAEGAAAREPDGPSPALIARMRDLNLMEKVAMRQEAGTGHGLLRIAGLISDEGYRLACRYAALRAAWRADNPGPKEAATAALPYIPPDRSTVPASQTLGSHEAEGDRIDRVRRTWLEVSIKLAAYPHLKSALDDAVLHNRDVRGTPRATNAVRGLKIVAPMFGTDPADVEPDKRGA